MTTQAREYEWRTRVTRCLDNTRYIALSTVDPENGVWVSPVYYAWDERFNLYFVSRNHTRHIENISRDSRVGITAYSTSQDMGDSMLSAHIAGNASILTGIEKITKAHTIYANRIKRDTGKSAYWKLKDFMGIGLDWVLVKVEPRYMTVLDSESFGMKQQLVPLDEL